MNTAYRAWHSYGKLQNNGKPVAIIYGMPTLVHALVQQFKPDVVYICWDQARSKHRLKLLPDYKAGRSSMTKEAKANFHSQRETAMKIFHALGMKQVITPEMEADDSIYMMVRKLSKVPSTYITIVSTDKDFHQLLSPTVKIWNTAKKILIHERNLFGHYGYTPKQCCDYLTLVGDSSDNIPGYPGIGEQKAKIFLSEYVSIREFLSLNESFGVVDKVKLEAIYKRNRLLINLKAFYRKYLRGVKLEITNFNESKLDKKALFKICDQYNIKMFKKKSFLKPYKK